MSEITSQRREELRNMVSSPGTYSVCIPAHELKAFLDWADNVDQFRAQVEADALERIVQANALRYDEADRCQALHGKGQRLLAKMEKLRQAGRKTANVNNLLEEVR